MFVVSFFLSLLSYYLTGFRTLFLRQDLMHYLTVNIGQAKIPSGVSISELLVVDAENM